MYENRCGPKVAHLRLSSRKGKVGGLSCDPGGGPDDRVWGGSQLAVGVHGRCRLAQPGSAQPYQLLPPPLPPPILSSHKGRKWYEVWGHARRPKKAARTSIGGGTPSRTTENKPHKRKPGFARGIPPCGRLLISAPSHPTQPVVGYRAGSSESSLTPGGSRAGHFCSLDSFLFL